MAEEKLNSRPDPYLFPNAEKQTAERNTKAYEFAQRYLVFDQHPMAKQLLAHWVAEMEARDIAPSASHAEYAYWEGRRNFIRGIQRQVELAKNPPAGMIPSEPDWMK
jgi:hypothetical protein